MPKRAPGRHTFHRNWRRVYFANSRYGAARAHATGCGWIDNDGQRSIDYEWINEHGAPSRFWFAKGDRAKEHHAEQLLKRQRVIGRRVYPLRSAHEALRDNAEHFVRTEWEVKDLRPITDEHLAVMFAELVDAARDAYGPNWHRHLVVKVLTDLGGGVPYALRICRAAHAAGVPTMLLARGRARFRLFRGHEEITYIRGSLRRLPR